MQEALLREQNKVLKTMVAMLLEILPRHTNQCGVHRAHFSYGDQYCDCEMNRLKADAKKLVRES